jgi:hypothetical protein
VISGHTFGLTISEEQSRGLHLTSPSSHFLNPRTSKPGKNLPTNHPTRTPKHGSTTATQSPSFYDAFNFNKGQTNNQNNENNQNNHNTTDVNNNNHHHTNIPNTNGYQTFTQTIHDYEDPLVTIKSFTGAP